MIVRMFLVCIMIGLGEYSDWGRKKRIVEEVYGVLDVWVMIIVGKMEFFLWFLVVVIWGWGVGGNWRSSRRKGWRLIGIKEECKVVENEGEGWSEIRGERGGEKELR